MCNRYKYTADIVKFFNERGIMVVEDEDFPPVNPFRDVYPKYAAPVLLREDATTYRMKSMKWGWPVSIKGKTTNVTNVRNLDSPMWKSALSNPARRCLVPFSEFCEPDWRSGIHVPAWFRVNEAATSCFAGIWRPTAENEAPVFSFLTCEANPLVGEVHPKAMPVVLDPDDYEGWLTDDHPNVCRLATPFPSQLMGMRSEEAMTPTIAGTLL